MIRFDQSLANPLTAATSLVLALNFLIMSGAAYRNPLLKGRRALSFELETPEALDRMQSAFVVIASSTVCTVPASQVILQPSNCVWMNRPNL